MCLRSVVLHIVEITAEASITVPVAWEIYFSMFVEITQQASHGHLGLLYFSTGSSEQRSDRGHTS